MKRQRTSEDGDSDEILWLQVGSERQPVSRKLLCSVPDSALARMFSEDWKDSKKVMVNDAIFLDRDPLAFASVLRYLRTQVIPWVDKNDQYNQVLRNELEFWGLIEVAKEAEGAQGTATVFGDLEVGKLTVKTKTTVEPDFLNVFVAMLMQVEDDYMQKTCRRWSEEFATFLPKENEWLVVVSFGIMPSIAWTRRSAPLAIYKILRKGLAKAPGARRFVVFFKD